MDWNLRYRQWITLYNRELRLNLYSLQGLVFMLLFLIAGGCLLWWLPGGYNIPESGYATMSPFFAIAPVLLLFLIPALSMRSVAEEKKLQTWTLLKSRPVPLASIVSAKILAIFTAVLIALLPTFIYVVYIYLYGAPVGNVDLGAVAASYMGLLFLVLAFVCLSVFASGLTANQVVALITGMLLCVFFYYGWNLLGLEKAGFLYHYQSIQRGLIETQDLCYFLLISLIACCLLIVKSLKINGLCILTLLLIVAGLVFNFRFDWTKDKRYSISPQAKTLLKTLDSPLEVELYLTGSLNPGFTRLKESAIHLLDDFARLSSQKIDCWVIDPYRQGRDFIEELNQNGMRGVAVNETSANGRSAQNIVYPYALVKYKDRETPVSLLVNQPGKSGEANLNVSVELLEYRFAHAIQLLTQNVARRIVFLEGHGELPEESLTEITDPLSYEYTIDRGVLSGRPGELDGYDLVIVAAPQLPFTEQDKFVLDQYLMQGHSLLWLVDGIRLHSSGELAQTGQTISRSNDLNLTDLFFTYGCRINPVILQDAQCVSIPLAQTNTNGQTDYIAKPWYYAPLLTPNPKSEITKGLSWVKTAFASTVSLVGDDRLKKEILLSSSAYAHTVIVPVFINLDEMEQEEKAYFDEQHLPVAVLLQGVFPSAFKNRPAFAQQNGGRLLTESLPAKMIVVASGKIIADPLGYDPYSGTQFSNREFLVNAINFLTDTSGIAALKNKSLQMQLLDKQALMRDRSRIAGINVLLPPLLLVLIFTLLFFIREQKISSFVI